MPFKLPERTVPYVVYIILFITPFLVYWPLWIHPQAMAYDMADYFLPCRHFIGECLQQGQFPWWNPYSGLGTPIAADPQSGAFYPITWIIGYFFGYDFFTINLDYLLHIGIAGWGMYALLRGLKYPVVVCLLLAWSYQFCGFFVNNAQHFSWIISAAWMPFFFHYYRQTFLKGNLPDAIRTALSLFMITTGGYPAFLIILIYLVGGHGLFFLTRNLIQRNSTEVFQWLKWSGIILIVYMAITVPYIFSFLQGVPLMTRGQALPMERTSFHPFTPQCVITFLLPGVPLGQHVAFETDTSMSNVYIGLITLSFFFTGIFRSKTVAMRTVLCVSLLMLLIAFGDRLPVWPFLFNNLPLIDHIRFPSAFRLFLIIGCIVVAAEAMKQDETAPSKFPAVVIVALLIVLAFLNIFASIALPQLLLPHDFTTAGFLLFFRESTVANNIVLQSWLQIVLLIPALFLFFSRKRWQSWKWYFLTAVFFFADLFISARINFPVIISSPFSVSDLNKKIVQTKEGFPMWNVETTVEVTNVGDGSFAPSYFNNNLFTHQFARDNFSPFELKLRNRLEGSPDKFSFFNREVIYLTNYLQAYNNDPDSNQLKNAAAVLVPDSIFNRFRTAGSDSLKSTIQLTGFTPSKFMVSATVDQQAILVLQQTYYPGWRVKADGKIIDPFIVNFCMMSVLLNPGQHQVTFYYDPGIMHWILILSTCLLLLCVGFLFLRAIKSIRAKA